MIIPEFALDKITPEEFGQHYSTIIKRIEEKKTIKTYHHQGELDEVVLHDFDYLKLRKYLEHFEPFHFQPFTLYRIVISETRNYMLTLFSKDITGKSDFPGEIPDIDAEVKQFIDGDNKEHFFSYSQQNQKAVLKIKNANSARNTVIKNLTETFQRHGLSPYLIQLWYMKTRNRKVKSIFLIEAHFDKVFIKEELNSIEADFERYLVTYIKPMSIFDLVGPSMVGPSSSHTAGANKIGQISRRIMIAYMHETKKKIHSVKVNLLGSFRDTGPGHRTPAAIGGGLLGYKTDDREMLSAGDPENLKKNGMDLESLKAKFEGYHRGTPEDDSKYSNDHNNNIAEIIFQIDNDIFSITGFSIGGGNVEVRYFNNERLADPITGKEDFCFHENKIQPAERVRNPKQGTLISALDGGTKNKNNRYKVPYNSFEELLEFLKSNGKTMLETLLEVEVNLQGSTKQEIYDQTQQYWEIMRTSVAEGVKSNTLSLLKLTGKDAHRLNNYRRKNHLFDNVFGKAVSYAVAVNEINAKSGVIVACPTAGSCGILPGVLTAWMEQTKTKDNTKVLESIMIAGFLGMILFNDVTTAGADYGCQAEIGSGAAMAAAAVTYLEGGSPEDIIHAFILALKNSLGLICDPVAGLVEIPCVKRNGIFASHALSASMMALAGVRSFISPDEVILTMKEVGDKLHRDYKETAGGGLAKTRDGKAVDKEFQKEVGRFFSEH